MINKDIHRNSCMKDNEMGESASNRLMFSRIARRYDLINRIISLGFDVGWRRKMAEAIQAPPNPRILDLATGTGDVALAIVKQYPDANVVGIDVCEDMLEIGREKVARKRLADRIEFRIGNAESLEFEDNSFDAATCAFGIRNFADRKKALRELLRAVKPGGRVAIIEPSKPRNGLFGHIFKFYFSNVVLLIGAGIADRNAYKYLVDSVENFPDPDDFCQELRQAGLNPVSCRSMTGGVATLYIAQAP